MEVRQKFLFALLLAIPSIGHSCNIYYLSSNNVVIDVIKEKKWTLKNYDEVCSLLEKSNASLSITGHATVLGNRSIAWVSVGVADKDLDIMTNGLGRQNTSIDDYASMDKAKDLLYNGIMSSVEELNLPEILSALDDSRQKVKNALSKSQFQPASGK